MNKGLGLAQSWASNEPQTEAAWFERFRELEPGQAVAVSGAFRREKEVRVVSHIEREREDLLRVYFMGDSFHADEGDGGALARSAEIRRDGSTVFSEALSLAWEG